MPYYPPELWQKVAAELELLIVVLLNSKGFQDGESDGGLTVDFVDMSLMSVGVVQHAPGDAPNHGHQLGGVPSRRRAVVQHNV
ncbi:MAG: hypothetical protein FRX49_08147 [Trebouxia sp. A1-2]|nr:MAG: hypothetical protein FRX49_13123 [Trebouxia sp. A1-2]KAA6421828.1 MAG: hypothetical protein FRX49_08147 [Trebouxia sp. A1-2]